MGASSFNPINAIPEFAVKLVISTLSIIISFFVFIENYKEILQVKYLLLATGFFLFCIYLLMKAKNRKKQFQLMIVSGISLILLLVSADNLWNALKSLYKMPLDFFIIYVIYIILNLFILTILIYIVEKLKRYVES
jgi:hypothetical protein